jgi:hypothetical protein
MNVFGVSRSKFSPPRKMFTDPADYGGNGPDVLSSLSESLTNARKSDPNAWTQISVPQKQTPAGTKTVPYAAQRALKRTVNEAGDTAPAQVKNKVFDAGMISKNSGRIVIIGQLGANDLQDTYKIRLNSDGKLNLFAPNPDYNSKLAGSKITLGDAQVEVFDSKGKRVATSDTRDGQGFSNWISLSTEGLGGLQMSRGDYTVKITRENPPSRFALDVTSAGELNFNGTVFDDLSRVGANLSQGGSVIVKNSEGVKYSATFQLVKKTEGGVSTATPAPAADAGIKGGPDTWELQLVSLTPVNKDDPKADPPPSGTAPVVLGTFKVFAAVGSAAAPKAEFTATNTAVNFEGGASAGSLSFAADKILAGDMKISADGAKTVANSKKVNYSLFAAIGDPGATTFYTVKNDTLTPAEQKKADEQKAVAQARQSAKAGSSGSILSLFS